MNKRKAVLGVGNALVDVIALVKNDEIIKKYNLAKGGMTLIDSSWSSNIYNDIKKLDKEIITGGSAANTITTLKSLSADAGYLGKVGHDDLGHLFEDEINKNGIANHLIMGKRATGRVMSLVTPNAERTMATYLGAAAEMQVEDIDSTIFQPYSHLYIEGYLVQNHLLIEHVIDEARKNGLKIAIDLSSYNIVKENLTFLKRLVKNKVDIVFANEEEAQAFTGLSPHEALDQLAEVCELAVVKIGKEGSLIKSDNQTIEIAPIAARAIDTTGAGDNYAAGFLFGLTRDYSLEKCGKIAALVAGKVVEVMGAKQSVQSLDAVKKEIAAL